MPTRDGLAMYSLLLRRCVQRRGTASLALGHLPATNSPIISNLNFFNSVTPNGEQIPTFRVLDGVGHPIDGAQVPEVRLQRKSVHG